MGSNKGYMRKKKYRAQTTAKVASGMSHDDSGNWVAGRVSSCSEASYKNSWSGAAGFKTKE